MVTIKNVSKIYNDKKVVEDVSLTIEKGTITSIIGPNGAGKSTLISMISRLIAKDSGEIRVDGKRVSQKLDHHLLPDPMLDQIKELQKEVVELKEELNELKEGKKHVNHNL